MNAYFEYIKVKPALLPLLCGTVVATEFEQAWVRYVITEESDVESTW